MPNSLCIYLSVICDLILVYSQIKKEYMVLKIDQ